MTKHERRRVAAKRGWAKRRFRLGTSWDPVNNEIVFAPGLIGQLGVGEYSTTLLIPIPSPDAATKLPVTLTITPRT